MSEYHKIQSLYKRDPETGRMLFGQYSRPEFEYLRYNLWDFTEKIDGMNVRVIWDGQEVRFGGKTDRADMPKDLIARLTELFPAEKLKAQFEDANSEAPVVLYGEGYGAGIQKGGQLSPVKEFILFDVRFGKWWLQPADVADIAIRLGCKKVPYRGTGNLYDMEAQIKTGIQSHLVSTPYEAEGIVARPKIGLMMRSGERVIVKLKGKDFRDASG